jgi:hypothetical protein
MKLLRITFAIFLATGADASTFARLSTAFAQAGGASSSQTQSSDAAAMNALLVAHLKPDERARFADECKSVAQSEQINCIVTRAFTAQCRAVIDKRLEPELLMAYPGSFVVKYLSPDEKPIVLQALRESTAALEGPMGVNLKREIERPPASSLIATGGVTSA